MTNREELIYKYSHYFDKCDPIPYKGVILNPFLTKDIRTCNYACYCLSVDNTEFNDITLMPLKRLSFIKTIIERTISGNLPKEKNVVDKYFMLSDSFRILMSTLFPNSMCDFIDPENSIRKKVITIFFKKESNYTNYVTLSEDEFEEMSELILYQNGIDTSWKDIPPAMRKEADKQIKLLMRHNKVDPPSIEKMIDGVFLILHDYEKIYSLPVRKFYNIIDLYKEKEHFNNMMSGMFDVKDIKHWLSGEYDKNPYKNIIQKESKGLKQLQQIDNRIV